MDEKQLLTVGDLIDKLSILPGSALVVVENGPVNNIFVELGANEPFVLLTNDSQSGQ